MKTAMKHDGEKGEGRKDHPSPSLRMTGKGASFAKAAHDGVGRKEKGEGKSCSETSQPGRGPIQGFEDLEVWQRAIDLAVDTCNALEHARNYSLRDQAQRAAISISSNIAEGYERDSNADFIRFLYYAKGSCGELRSQLHLAARLGLMAAQHSTVMLGEARLLSRKLGAYIRVRENRFS